MAGRRKVRKAFTAGIMTALDRLSSLIDAAAVPAALATGAIGSADRRALYFSLYSLAVLITDDWLCDELPAQPIAVDLTLP